MIDESRPPNNPWTRKHDDPRINLIPEAQRIVYPKTLKDLIDLCKDRDAPEHLKAAGSHWALSRAAISDHTFIETHDPREGSTHQVLGRTLNDVIPGCLNRDFLVHKIANERSDELKTYLVHVEAGKRIYQLYAELDQTVDVNDASTLAGFIKQEFQNSGYAGPWAFPTLGGAGGQTIVGAFNTGTHGMDFDRSPIADSIIALHLVADGGKQYWIEPDDPDRPPLVDETKLKQKYPEPEIEVKRSNLWFNAALVSVGRFGVIYSVVLRAVPQYALHEQRRLDTWQNVKKVMKDKTEPLFNAWSSDRVRVSIDPPPQCRSLQIAVCLTPHENFTKNLVGITKRWEVPMPGPPWDDTIGRLQRVGPKLADLDDRLQAPLFARAGNQHPYNPESAEPSLLERACADAGFLRGLLIGAIEELDAFVSSGGGVVGDGIRAIATVSSGGVFQLDMAFLQWILSLLKDEVRSFDDSSRLGEHVENIKNILLADEEKRAAGLFVWQLIIYKLFASEQHPLDFGAISYAVMDRKDYLNISCEVNVDSVEVFFDAGKDEDGVMRADDLINFIDGLILFEMNQEFNGKAFAGYASLRFMGPTRALLGMQKFARTCSVEVACLKDVSGSQELVDYAVTLAQNRNLKCLVHWGQKNNYTQSDVEFRYGADLTAWRTVLAQITDGGRLNRFSSEFTVRTGLEVI
jgi:hypothetical protein